MDAQSLYDQTRLRAMHRRMDELGIPHEKRAGIMKMMPAAWKLGQGVMGKAKNVGMNILRRPGIVGGAESPLAVGAGALRKPFQAIANNPIKAGLGATAGVGAVSGAAGVGLGSAATQNHMLGQFNNEMTNLQNTFSKGVDFDAQSPYSGGMGWLAKLMDILFNRERFQKNYADNFVRHLAGQNNYSGQWARSRLAAQGQPPAAAS